MTPAALLEHVTKTIVERFHSKRIVVIGSHARGEARPDRDLDLFIEMDTPRCLLDRAIEVSEAVGLRPWPMDIGVYTPEEVRRLRHVNGTLLSVIEKAGKVLHEQPRVQLLGVAPQSRARPVEYREQPRRARSGFCPGAMRTIEDI